MGWLQVAHSLAVACCITGPVEAPRGEALRGEYESVRHTVIPVRFLLNEPLVREELRLPEATRDAVIRLTGQYLADHQAAREALESQVNRRASAAADLNSGKTADETQKQVQEHFAAQKTATDRFEEALVRLLDAEQRLRLEQIDLQLAGLPGLQLPRVKRLLSISPDQSAELERIRSGATKEVRSAIHQARERQEELEASSARVAEIREAATQEGLKVLNPRQRHLYEAACGTPIRFSRRDITLEIRGARIGSARVPEVDGRKSQ